MIYDLSKEIDRERLATRVKALTAKGAMVEFTEKAVRSNSQNRYLHALLGALAIDTGETSVSYTHLTLPTTAGG